MIVGFTGTRQGMTKEQARKVFELLALLAIEDRTAFHHGNCVGSDEAAAAIAMGLGYTTVAHTGDTPEWRSTFVSDIFLPEKDNLERNKVIVDSADTMIAAPAQTTEVKRGSGTWQAIRYARKTKTPLDIIWPNGVKEHWNTNQ